MGQYAFGEKPYRPVGVFLVKNCTGAVPHNVTLFVEFEITIVPEQLWLVY